MNLGSFKLREALAQDANQIELLFKLLVENDGNISVEPGRLEELSHDSNNFLFVCEVDGKICGTAFLTICLDAMYGFQPYGVVENVIVHPEFRKAGVGKQLLQHIEEKSCFARCTKVMLLSSQRRIESHRFFEACGYDSSAKKGFVKYLNRKET